MRFLSSRPILVDLVVKKSKYVTNKNKTGFFIAEMYDRRCFVQIRNKIYLANGQATLNIALSYLSGNKLMVVAKEIA